MCVCLSPVNHQCSKYASWPPTMMLHTDGRAPEHQQHCQQLCSAWQHGATCRRSPAQRACQTASSAAPVSCWTRRVALHRLRFRLRPMGRAVLNLSANGATRQRVIDWAEKRQSGWATSRRTHAACTERRAVGTACARARASRASSPNGRVALVAAVTTRQSVAVNGVSASSACVRAMTAPLASIALALHF